MLHRLIYRERGTVPSTSWVMYATLDEILSLFQRFVEQIVEEVRALDDLVLILDRREQGDLLRRIGASLEPRRVCLTARVLQRWPGAALPRCAARCGSKRSCWSRWVVTSC